MRLQPGSGYEAMTINKTFSAIRISHENLKIKMRDKTWHEEILFNIGVTDPATVRSNHRKTGKCLRLVHLVSLNGSGLIMNAFSITLETD